MSEFQKQNLKVIIGSAATAAGETTLSTFKTSGSVGEVIAVEGDGTAVASTSENIIVVGKNADGTLNTTEAIPVKNVTKAVARKYAAATNKVDYIGFNGTSGSIDETASNLYQIFLRLRNAGSLSAENWYLRDAAYQSSAVAATYSQEAVAEGLVKSLIRNLSREPLSGRMKVEMVTSDAGDALGTGTATGATVVFTKGSRYVTGWANVDDATTNAALAVGNYLRVGTAVTDPVYKIKSIDTTNDILELEWAFQGETTTLNDTGLEQVTAADVAAGDCGIKISGKDEDYSLGRDRFEILDWHTDLSGFTETEVTKATAGSLGEGEGKRVRDLEWFAVGNFGDLYRFDDMAFDFYQENLESSATGKYHSITIDYFVKTDLFQDVTMPRQLIIYCSAGAGTDYTAINKVIDLLNNATGSAQLAALSALS
jgi:hypothetical protein